MTTRYPLALIKDKLLARQGRLLDFAIGQHVVRLPEKIRRWVCANAELALKPASRAEVAEFAAAAAGFIAREYLAEVPAECILPTPGGRPAMAAFIACTLNPGDKVLVTEPGYPAFARLAVHRHADVLVRYLDPGNGFSPCLDTGAGGDARPLRVIALNYPNNPTGATLSAGLLTQFNRIASAETVLFNDATYGPLVYDERPGSLLGHRAASPQREVVELHSMSKLFPLGPASASFLAGSEETLRQISTYSEFAWPPMSRLQIEAATLCLRDSGRSRDLRGFYREQLRRLRETLERIGFEPFPVPAGVYALCKVPLRIGGKPVASAADAADRLIEEFDLAVVPLDAAGRGYLRFSSLFRAEDLARLSDMAARLQLA